jgi:flagellar basal body-associated protein FliL
MAELTNDDVEVGPNEVLVERRIVPARRGLISPLGVIIVLAFIATCGYVFFGGNIGTPQNAPQAPSAQTPATTP